MDDSVAVAKKKFNNLQKYVPFLEKFTSCINNNEQLGDEAFVKKRNKCLQLLGMLKTKFDERWKLSLLVNIEDTVEKLMEQSGDRIINSKSYKQERCERDYQSPVRSSNHASSRQIKNETLSTSKDRKELRNSYNDTDKHPRNNGRQRSDNRSRSPESYRNRSPTDHRRKSSPNYRHRRSRSRSSERYKSDHRYRTDFKREDKSRRSRSRERHSHRDHRQSNEGNKRERSYDYSKDRDKFESNESYTHRSRYESSYTRDDRDKRKYSYSPLLSTSDPRSKSGIRSVFDRLEPRMNASAKRPVISNSQSRFESNADWDDTSQPRKTINDEALLELNALTENRFGRSEEDEKLFKHMELQKKAEKMRADLKKKEQIESAKKLLNEIQATGDYVRKDSNSVISPSDRGETKKSNEPSNRNERNESIPNSKNNIPSQRTAIASQDRIEPITSARSQYINPWLNKPPDPRQRDGNENGSHASMPFTVFGGQLTSNTSAIISDQILQTFHTFGNSNNVPSISPLNDNRNSINNALSIVGQSIPIIAAPPNNHSPFGQNSKSYSNGCHQYVPNHMHSNQRPFNQSPPHNGPASVNRKANVSYGQYKRARENLEKSQRSNILVTTTTAPISASSTEQSINEPPRKSAAQVDTTNDSNNHSHKDVPSKNVSDSDDKRFKEVLVNSSIDKPTQTKYRIPKLNRSDSSNNSKQQNQLQEPPKEKEKSKKSSNPKHTEKSKEKTQIRAKTKDSDPRPTENSQVFADTTTDSEPNQSSSSSRNDSNVIRSSTPTSNKHRVVSYDDNDEVVSSSTPRRDNTSSGSNALNSSHSDSNERPNKEKRKPVKPKKNELDRLNEDIMANCNDVVMATGKRSCTIASRKGHSEDSVSKATQQKLNESIIGGESSDETDEPKVKRKKIIKSKQLIDDTSDDSQTADDEIPSSRRRPGPKCTSSAKKSMIECKVILERLDEAIINKYMNPNDDENDDENDSSYIKNTNQKMTAKDSKECVLCQRSYRQLARHYNSVHEGKEVYCARMSVENSNKVRNGKFIQKIVYEKGKSSVRCLFCNENVRKDSLGRLIDHFMAHTGEFIKKCTKCGVTVNGSTIKTPNCAHSKHRQENLVQFTDNIYVYMCNICNYAQAQEENLKDHIMNMHEIKSNVFEQYKKIILVTNLGGRRSINTLESESNDATSEVSNQEAFKPSEPNDDPNEKQMIRIIKENSFDHQSINAQTARKRTMADQLHERLGRGHDKRSNDVKSESSEDAVNVILRGADEVSDNDTDKTNVSSDQDRLTGEAIENTYKIEIAKEEIQISPPNVKKGNNVNNDEEEWESCSTGSDDDHHSDGKFNNKLSTRLTSVSGKSKTSKVKFKTKKRNDKSIFGSMSCKKETPEGIINLINEDDNINVGASTSQQSHDIECSTKRIENFAFTETDNQLKYTCYIGNCNFISLNNSSSFSNHLRKHSEAWTGYCHSCDKQILNGGFSLMKEFNHMIEIHLPNVNKVSKPIKSATNDFMLKINPEPMIEESIAEPAEPEKPVFRLKIRRLSGDLLSGPTTSDGGIIISNVTSLSASKNEVDDLQSFQDQPIEEDTITDNSMKPWTKCRNTKSAIASLKLSRQISLVALFKCMAIDCIFTTSDRNAMLAHLNNHEDFLIQPANNVPAYTDSYSWLECCYCEEILDSCTVLVDHIEEQHSSSIFQCAYCFYRSVDPCNVNSHINFYHEGNHRAVLICGTHPKCLSEEIDLLTSKCKNLKKIPCTFPECDESSLCLSDLNDHLNQLHEGKTYYRCPFCPMRLSKSENDEIDVSHFQDHNIYLYHCAHCPDFGTFNSDSMRNHLRDEHPNRLAHAIARFNSGLPNAESQASIARAFRFEQYYLFHSTFTLEQINFMNPSLSEYVANSGEVPKEFYDPAKALAHETTYKKMRQSERKESEYLYKEYHIYTFDQLETGSWKTLSPAHINDNLGKQMSQHQGTAAINETTGQLDYEISIQNEIDASAKALLSETGIDTESFYHCGLTNCRWSCSNGEGNEFLMHLSQHHLTVNSHKCYYCHSEFNKPVELKTHIDATHTLHRYFCFLCNNTEASEQRMIDHFKNVHKNNSMRFIPLNPCRTNRTKDIFIGCPANVSFINDFGMKLIERRENKMLTKKFYSPEEVHLLPNRHVFIDDVQCKKCNYKSKVRSNMERHLFACKNSVSIETIPEQAPVNPVPHLDTGEMYSSKMKNLAASSNLTDDSTTANHLRYVPECERFMCGADGCSYKTHNSELLHTHFECSHNTDTTYYCPHCRMQLFEGIRRSANIIIIHLRFHAEKIFKCQLCSFGHYEKNDAERHISDVHPTAKLQTIIRPEKPADFIKPIAKANISKWKCNICTKQQFNTKLQVQQHLSADHQIKHNYYQCGICSFQGDAKVRIKEHLSAVHGHYDVSQLKMLFEQVDDNSPLWRRDDPARIKHIRGILFEDEENANSRISNVKVTATTSSNRKQTWTCDIPSFAAASKIPDRFVIVPSKNTIDESAVGSGPPRPAATRQMPKRRASMFISSPSELMSLSSYPQPPISIRFKRINDSNIDGNLMPPPAKVFKNDSDANRSSFIYQCDYCSASATRFDAIHKHWQDVHRRDKSTDPEAKQFRCRVTVQIQCIHCTETMAFASIWDHSSRMHSNEKFAFAKFDPMPSNGIHCGMCSKKVSNKNDLEMHFSHEHATSINSKSKIPPMPFFNDAIVETLIAQGNHEAVKCLRCQERFICTFDFEQHHQQSHPQAGESHEPTDPNPIKYGCIECQIFSTHRNDIISHMWKNHTQSRYRCLYCSKETQFQKLISTHHELAHKSNELRYRIVDASENVSSFYRMTMNFSNGLVFFWGDMLKTKFGEVKQLIAHVNELNRSELESYVQSAVASMNIVHTPGKIGSRRRQTHLL